MELEQRQVLDIVKRARDTITVRRVYGDPIEKDGTIVIPAASIAGGGGGGTGIQEGQSGTGGGFGMRARPVGAFVIEDGKARWEPVVDRERQALLSAALAGAVMLTVRSLLRRRRRRRHGR
jgi:uncharacterized spore protein YtfJ